MPIPEFFRFAKERHSIWLKRQRGASTPWTKDPILQQYKFTNVFRELDRTTVWFREHVREPLRDDRRVFAAIVIFRWFNLIRTGELLHGFCPDLTFKSTDLFRKWDSEFARRRLIAQKPVTNGAYIIKTIEGKNKLDGILYHINNFMVAEPELYKMMVQATRLEHMQEALRGVPYLGPFMAYEIVTDLRHTHVGEHATDINSWANPGPGACRGLGRVLFQDPGRYKYGSRPQIATVMEGMRSLLKKSRNPSNWPTHYPEWEMREVEHTLCEFDKYERARLGEGRPKQLYRGEKP
jgi:hypothetical protein